MKNTLKIILDLINLKYNLENLNKISKDVPFLKDDFIDKKYINSVNEAIKILQDRTNEKNNSCSPGSCNAGINNSGNWNSGDYNSGNWNSGDYNSGNRNAGDYNSGNWNSGDYNSGDYNSGDGNSGDYNSGDYNSGNRNAGFFNRDTPPLRFFEKETNVLIEDIKFPDFLYFDLIEWIDKKDMSEDEKAENPSFETTNGYLKTYEYKEAFRKSWDKTQEDDKRLVLELPNFDNEIFKDISGIDVYKELGIQNKS